MKWLLLLILTLSMGHASLQEAANTNIQSTQNTQASQTRVDATFDATQAAFAAYMEMLEEIETLKTYNDQLRAMIVSQEVQIQSLGEQIVEIEVTSQRIMPLMQKMIEGFDAFVKADIPFLEEERLNRSQKLSTLLANPGLSISQKYRTIMEAYGIELEFSRTIESFTAPLGERKNVQFLRIGRTGLYYLTLDEAQVGMYDPHSQSFVALDHGYVAQIKKGIKIAQKQQAPDVLRLPVFRSQGSLK